MKRIFTLAFLISYFFSFAQDYNFALAIDLVPGSEGIADNYIHFEKDGLIYLILDTDGNGEEVWTTDGTESGTQKLFDMPSGNEDSSPGQFTFIGDKLFYTAEDSIHGDEPWITDFTEEGTFMLKDIIEGSESSFCYDGIVYNDKLYFVVNAAGQYDELWVTDGSKEGTESLNIIFPNFREFHFYKDKFIFSADFNIHISDGSEDGTTILYDYQDNTSVPFNGSINLIDDSLIYNSHYLDGLFVADGTQHGNRLIHKEGARAWKMQKLNDKIFYLADVTNGFGWRFNLYCYDAALDSVTKFYPEQVYSRSLFNFNNRIYFRDEDKLYSSNGEMSDLAVEYEEKSNEHLKPLITDDYLIITEFYNTFIKEKEGEMVKVLGTLSDPFIYNDVLYGYDYENETGYELYQLDLTTLETSSVPLKFTKVENVVYPNPTDGFVTVKNKYNTLEIYDLSGQRLGLLNSYKAKIDLNNYRTGMYLFKIYSDEGVAIQKIYKN